MIVKENIDLFLYAGHSALLNWIQPYFSYVILHIEFENHNSFFFEKREFKR